MEEERQNQQDAPSLICAADSGGGPWSPINWLRWELQTLKCIAPHQNKLVFIFVDILWIDLVEKAQLNRFHKPLKETVKILFSPLHNF